MPPGIFKLLDSIRCEDQVQVERTVLKLNEILASVNLLRLLVRQLETKIAQGVRKPFAIAGVLFDKKDRVLRCVGIAEQNCTRFADE
jgi:hypothetical protein